jgi:hypothetical protein
MLKAELDYKDVEDFYSTDSEVVLGFINSESRRFHVYVANRAQLIRDHTAPEKWKHVSTANNSADEASRGVTAKAFLESSKSINCRDFLWQTDEDNPEVKKVWRQGQPGSEESQREDLVSARK